MMTHFDSTKSLVSRAMPRRMVSDLFWLISWRTESERETHCVPLKTYFTNRGGLHSDQRRFGRHIGIDKVPRIHVGSSLPLLINYRRLLGLFGETMEVPQTLSSRWALYLAAYEYQMLHCPGLNIPQAGAVSRLPYANVPARTCTSTC